MCSENERPDRLIRMLYDIADDAEAPANSRLSAIKEILDRTVGKGVMLGGEQTEVQPVEIVFSDRRRYEFPVTRRQAAFMQSDTLETLFGGAAGGGKSHGQLLDALRFAVCYPGSRQLMRDGHAGAGALACTGGFAAVSAVHCKVQGE